jgi:hypothetical protein
LTEAQNGAGKNKYQSDPIPHFIRFLIILKDNLPYYDAELANNA